MMIDPFTNHPSLNRLLSLTPPSHTLVDCDPARRPKAKGKSHGKKPQGR